MSSKRLEKIVIVGGGAVGWTVAAVLAHALQMLGIHITVLSGENIDEAVLPCESTTPAMVAFNSLLGIGERKFITSTGSAYQLALEYKWSLNKPSYFMPFTDHGFMLNRLNFSNYAIFGKLMGDTTSYDEYSLSAMAAKDDRFCLPSPNPNSLFSTLSYGFQLNTNNCSEYLRRYAMNLGVKNQSGELLGAYLDASDGSIDNLRIKSDDALEIVIEADLFIDCSGARSFLIGDLLGVDYGSLNNELPANRVITMQDLAVKKCRSSSSIQLTPFGFAKRISTQTQSQTSFYYHTDFACADTMFSQIPMDARVMDPEIHQLHPGQRNFFWHKNCVAIGGAAGYIHDLVIGRLHLVQSAALRLATLFPKTKEFEFQAKEYNRLTNLEYTHIIDFHQLHYKLGCELADGPYWDSLKKLKLTQNLTHRLLTFDYRGIIPFYEGETLSPGTWISLLLGAGRCPESYDTIIDTMNKDWIYQNLRKMRNMIREAATKISYQAEFMEKNQ